MTLLERILFILWTNSLGLAVLTGLVLLVERRARLRMGTRHLLWATLLVGYLAPFLAPGERLVYSFPGGDDTTGTLVVCMAFGVWALGGLMVTTRIIAAQRRLKRSIAQRTRTPVWLEDHVDDVAQRIGLARPPRTFVIDGNGSPFITSLISPQLVVPRAWLEDADESRIAVMLAHELAHVRRRDAFLATLAAVITITHWWNPLAHLARRRLELAAEMCCDDAVVTTFPEARRIYADALIETAAASIPPRSRLALSGAGRDLAQRIERVFTDHSTSSTSLFGWIGLAAFLLCCALNVPGVKGLRYNVVHGAPPVSDHGYGY